MNTSPAFHGVIPPVITPRTPAGDVDHEGLRATLDHLIAGGVHGVFLLGSTGETPYLTDRERRSVVESAAEIVGGRVPLIVGANESTAPRVAEEARMMRDCGAEAVVVSSPYYILTDPAELLEHFRIIAQAVDLPMFAYNVPVRTHIPLPSGLLAELAREGTIIGVKDSSNDDVAFRQLSLATRDIPEFSLCTGHEVVCDGAMLAGAHGLVPGLANVDPAGYVRLYEAARSGDWETARTEQDRLARLFRIVTVPDPARVSGGAAGLGAFKTALVALGVIESNEMSRPLQALDEHESAGIRGILREEGLLT